MVVSSPERAVHGSVLMDAAVAGVALGAVALAGGSMVLFRTGGLLQATAGLIASMVVALLVGMWAAAPAVEQEQPSLRERWLLAVLSLSSAGVYATFLQLNEVAAGGVLVRVATLLLLTVLPAYSLGMTLPVLLGWGRFRLEAVTGEVVGESVVAWLSAGVLGGLALGVLGSGYLMLRGVAAGPTLLAAAAVLLAPLLRHSRSLPISQEQLLFEADTPLHSLRVTEVVHPGDRQPERRLYLNGEEESGELVRSGAPTLAYVAAAEVWLAATTSPGSAYLFLGGGACTLPRRVAERDRSASITVVEIDPEVTAAAYRFFGLRPDHQLHTVHGDARSYLESADAARFDRIYVDVYSGQESLPFTLVTREAFLAMRARLRPDGIVAMNVIGTTHGPESTRFWSVLRTFATVFPMAGVYLHLGRDFPDRQNILVVGAMDEGVVMPERAGTFERWPREEWPEVEAATVLRDLAGGEEGVAGEVPTSEVATTKGEH